MAHLAPMVEVVTNFVTSFCGWLTSPCVSCFRAKSVPENILKKQARDAKILAFRKAQREQAKKDRAEARKVAAANAKKYAEEYATADKAEIDAKRKAKAEGNFYVPAEAKIAFVLRTRG